MASSESPLDGLTDELTELQDELTGQLDNASESLDKELADLTSSLGGAESLGDTGQALSPPADAAAFVHPEEWAGLLEPQSEQVHSRPASCSTARLCKATPSTASVSRR